MIITTIIRLWLNAIIGIIELLPQLPNIPQTILDNINGVVNLIFSNVGLLSLFIPLTTINVLVPIFISGFAFFHLYDLIMWIIEKIPAIDIDK